MALWAGLSGAVLALYVVSVGLSCEVAVRLAGASAGMAGSLSLQVLSPYGVCHPPGDHSRLVLKVAVFQQDKS